ncbi:hypothetical protein EIN_087260, partial [Entamoeba invadens IP1]|uniref:hypothetical protein n=1 Tax=Entamoeba invadens IP1 TaxID=370355 RepID=UPI0002C3FA85
IANLAGERAETRDFMLNEGIVKMVTYMYTKYSNNESLLTDLVFIIRNLCINNDPCVPYDKVQETMPIIITLLKPIIFDKPYVPDAIWTLSFLLHDKVNFTELSRYYPLVLQYYRCDFEPVLEACVSYLGGYVEHGSEQCTIFGQPDIFERTKEVLCSDVSAKTKSRLVTILYNMVYTRIPNVEYTTVSQFLPLLINYFIKTIDDHDLKLEVGLFAVECIETTNPAILEGILSIPNFFEFVILLFEIDDSSFILRLLVSLRKLLVFDSTYGNRFKIAEQLEERQFNGILSSFELVKYAKHKLILNVIGDLTKILNYRTTTLF